MERWLTRASRFHQGCRARRVRSLEPRPSPGRFVYGRKAPMMHPRPRHSRRPIGVSTYSFWQFRGERLGIAACIDKAAAMGFDGVEILHVQMQDESNAAAPEDQAPGPFARTGADGVLDAPGVRQPRRRAAANERPEDALPDRPGLPAGHPHDADQHRPLGDDQVVRRPDGQEGDRAAARGPHRGRGVRLGDRRRSRNSCRAPRSAAWCSAWRTTGAWAGPPRACCGSSRRSSPPGCR